MTPEAPIPEASVGGCTPPVQGSTTIRKMTATGKMLFRKPASLSRYIGGLPAELRVQDAADENNTGKDENSDNPGDDPAITGRRWRCP